MPNAFNQRNQYPMQQPNISFNPMQMQQPNIPFNQMPYQMQQLMQNPLNMPYQPLPQARPTQIEEEDEDVEVVPETQPEPSKKKNTKGKGKKEDAAAKQQQRPWSKIEEEALAKAYISSSTSPIIGNNQQSDGFWQEALDIFHAIMEQGEYRTVDSISPKWRKMNTLIQRFCGFYNTTLANKPSGWNNENDQPKWKGTPNEVASAKRATKWSKSSESGSYSVGDSTGRCQININDEPEYEEEPIGEEERPPGRDKSKKIAAEKRKQAASGSGGGSKLEGIMAELKAFNQTFTETQTEKIKVKKQQAEEKQRRQEEVQQLEEWKIMTTDLSEYPPEDRPILQMMKEKIRKKWSGGV
ncbi:uncharacterized protein LOC110901579 [Helianthus annuus]|uniref:uncharacterized protein LOC110901579 n=1 Tax=Helianthus annuus TaxID=4232 RepID=UPI000B8F444B|nr:uncharacterized protein LOC110901579 [Helianthus annuus]